MEASAVTPSPPRLTVGGVISEALDLYGRHAGTLIGGALAVYVVTGIVQGLCGDSGSILLGILGSLLNLVAWAFFTGFVVNLVADVRDGKRDFGVGRLFSSASDAVLPLIGNGILFAIAVTIGLVLLVVPGLFLLTVWAVAPAAVVAERRGAIEAFGRSYELVRGHAWTVFGAIIVALLIAIGVAILAAALGAAIGDLTGRIIFVIIANVLTAPFAALISSVLFFSLGGTATGVDRGAPAAPAAPAA